MLVSRLCKKRGFSMINMWEILPNFLQWLLEMACLVHELHGGGLFFYTREFEVKGQSVIQKSSANF